MSCGVQARARLLSYMKEALDVCLRLKAYTEEKQDVFLQENDRMIIEAIQKREPFIGQLISLEYRIDLILDEVDEYAGGGALPREAEVIRRRIREISKSIMDMDSKAMKTIGSKMQRYKDETLKARNKKNLSAYIRANVLMHSISSYDFLN